ncbi:MAG: hypothetical protein HW421_2164 [Ignavibacteria bacterium]|nr:hypothetical protein [Ignavibacteria bacterium]
MKREISFLKFITLVVLLVFIAIGCKEDPVKPINHQLNSKIDSISPAYGFPGRVVTIHGDLFDFHKNKTHVYFNNTEAVIQVFNNTYIKVIIPNVPSGIIPLKIDFNGDRRIVTDSFKILKDSLCTIDSIRPKFGAAGKIVTVYGSGYGYLKDFVKIYFAQTPAEILQVTDNEIKLKVPIVKEGKVPIFAGYDSIKTQCPDSFLVINTDVYFSKCNISYNFPECVITNYVLQNGKVTSTYDTKGLTSQISFSCGMPNFKISTDGKSVLATISDSEFYQGTKSILLSIDTTNKKLLALTLNESTVSLNGNFNTFESRKLQIDSVAFTISTEGNITVSIKGQEFKDVLKSYGYMVAGGNLLNSIQASLKQNDNFTDGTNLIIELIP